MWRKIVFEHRGEGTPDLWLKHKRIVSEIVRRRADLGETADEAATAVAEQVGYKDIRSVKKIFSENDGAALLEIAKRLTSDPKGLEKIHSEPKAAHDLS